MDIFDVKRRDNPPMDKHMNPKAPPFGGPSEKSDFHGNKRKMLNKYQREITRNRDFEGNLHDPSTGEEMNQHNYDSAWAAITRDKISRDAKKKPTNIMYAKQTTFTSPIEEGTVMRFDQFVSENYDPMTGQSTFEAEDQTEDLSSPEPDDDTNYLGYEVDEEQLEKVMDEYGDDLNELIDKIAEELEVEKEAVCDLLCAAIEKICNPEDEELKEPVEDNTSEFPENQEG